MIARPKYRIWHKIEKKMYPLEGIDLTEPGIYGYITVWDRYGQIYSSVDKIDAELMQWTGWLDQRKQPVYEQDIVLIGGKHGVVVWDTPNDGWRIAVGYTYNLRVHDMLVVGNVWENPELYNPDAGADETKERIPFTLPEPE